MKRGEETLLPNWAISAACKLPGSAGPVLLAIARRANYRDCTVKLGYLMDETGQGERTVQKALQTLRDLNHIVSVGGEHVLYGACSRYVHRVCKNVHPQQPFNAVSDDENPSLNKGTKEERNKNTPLPPTALPATAGEGETPEPQQPHENGITPSRELTPNAASNPTSPANVPEVQPSPVTSGRAENHKLPVELVPTLLALWNDHRAALPRAELTSKRARALGQVVEILGEHAATRWEHAVREVAQDPYWRKKKYGLDNLLAGQKYVAKAEAWAQRHPEAQLLPEASASPPPEVLAPLELTVPEGSSPFLRSSSEIDWDNVRPPTGRYAHLARYNPAAPLPPELQ